MSDVGQQLSAALGHDVGDIRKTSEVPARISVIDVAAVITGKNHDAAAQDFRRISERYPDVSAKCTDVKFRDSRGRKGQRNSPACDVKTICEIIFLLPGRHAAQVRQQAASLLCRYLGGDLAIVDEVCRMRGFQEQLAVQQPDDPRRAFGQEVEAASGGPVAEQLALACTEAITRALPEVINQLTAHIDGRLQGRPVNLNVRAPKRTAPHDPPIAKNLAGAGRPLPLARFLDEKERAYPSLNTVRRSCAPSFGIIAQVLKKRKLKEDGAQPIYVEQNHRAQIWYSEADRPLLQEAWEMTAAHREDLLSRYHPLRAIADRPSIVDLLRCERE